MGIMGAAIATLASYIVMAVTLFIVAEKFYKIDYEYAKIVKIFVLIISSGVVYYYLYDQELLNIVIKFLILIGFISSIFILRIVEKREFEKILSLFKSRLNR